MICDNIIIITELGRPQQADLHAGLLPHSVSPPYFSRGHCLHKVLCECNNKTNYSRCPGLQNISDSLKTPLIYFSVKTETFCYFQWSGSR